MLQMFFTALAGKIVEALSKAFAAWISGIKKAKAAAKKAAAFKKEKVSKEEAYEKDPSAETFGDL